MQFKLPRFDQRRSSRKRATLLRMEPLESRDTPSITLAGTEFRAHTTFPGDQSQSQIAMDANGNYVVVWQDSGLDGFGSAAVMRRFQADGTPLGSDFVVNSTTFGSQGSPDIAMRGDGDFVVVWESFGQDGSGKGVFGQRFSANGTPAGTEFAVNTTTTGDQGVPVVAMAEDGTFVVAWEGNDASGTGIYLRRYSATGSPLTGEVVVNADTGGDQKTPALAMQPSGDFILAWSSVGTNAADIFVRRFHANTSPKEAEFRTNTSLSGDQIRPDLGIDGLGNFVVVWHGTATSSVNSIFGRRYDSNAVPLTGEISLCNASPFHQTNPRIAVSPGGTAVVAWQRDEGNGVFHDVLATVFDAGFNVLRPQAVINTFTTASQDSPAVIIDGMEDAVITWNSYSQDTTFNGVYGQRFDTTGAPVFVALSTPQVEENAANATLVGTLSAIDPDPGDTVTFELINDAGGRFALAGGQVTVADGSLLDYDLFPFDHTYTIVVKATDNQSNWVQKNIVIKITNVNEAPTGVGIETSSIAENQPNDSVVGTLNLIDPDYPPGPNYGEIPATFALLDDAGGRFKLVGRVIQIADTSKIDFELTTQYTLQIRATDAGNLFGDFPLVIQITNANEAPTAVNLSQSHVAENSAAGAVVGTLQTTDPDAGDAFTYTLVDDAGKRFKLVGNVLQTTGKPLLDQEAATSHDVQVKVTDAGGLSKTVTLTIQVDNVDETPNRIDLSQSSVPELSLLNTIVGTLSTPRDTGDTHTFTLVSNPGGKFKIVGNEVRVASPTLNYETAKSYTIRVRVEDQADHAFEKDFVISIINVNEAPYYAKIPGGQQIFRNGSVVFKDANANPIRIWDVDAGTGALQMSINAASGTIKLGSTVGLSKVLGNGTKSVTLQGKLATINNALQGLVYTPPAGFTGSVKLSLITNDLGNTGTGGAKTASGTILVNVINRKPTIPLAGLPKTFYYAGPKNKALNVLAASGVLRGKTDADGDTLRTYVFKAPTKGSVVLKNNGSFVFTPPKGFVGSIQFTLRYSDGLVFSDPVTVNVRFY